MMGSPAQLRYSEKQAQQVSAAARVDAREAIRMVIDDTWRPQTPGAHQLCFQLASARFDRREAQRMEHAIEAELRALS